MHGAWGRLFKATRPLSSHNGVVLAWAMLIIGWGILRNV
jgi:hypothetical protein